MLGPIKLRPVRTGLMKLSALAAMIAITFGIVAVSFANEQMAQELIDNLTTMKSIYGVRYAPADWKKKFAAYDLETNYSTAVESARSKADLTQSDTRKILKDFVYAMRDYHVSMQFYATEEATLPLTIRSAGGRYFIAYIDREKLPEDVFRFTVGDEVEMFNGQPIAEVVRQLQNEFAENVISTDQAIAENNLTRRRAARGLDVPQGAVTLTIKPAGTKKTFSQQLVWNYKPEQVSPRFMSFAQRDESAKTKKTKANFIRPMMHAENLASEKTENPFGMGAKKTFTPELGNKIWSSSSDSIFDAYIYMNEDRKLIGYVRIAGYITEDYVKAVDEFASIIQRFESVTDAMIIDQVNNPGGSVFYLYALASMLSDRPLITPLHRMSIIQEDVLEAVNMAEEAKKIKNDEDAKKNISRTDTDGYPVSYQFVQFSLNYAQFLVNEWNAGRTLSHPFWIAGVNHINPSPIHYTKPILVLVNALDFSGGDFFPTILQDNQRATIMGTRTAGAGGYVHRISAPNSLGVANFSITASIAERVNGNPIENLGVTPDVNYELTPEDYMNNFAPYVAEIQKNVKALIK